MFMSSASELFAQSSSFHCQLERGHARLEEAVFHLPELEARNGKQSGYQLIRGALAAYATGCACDSAKKPSDGNFRKAVSPGRQA
jgi:hypothetical protein